MQAFRKLCVVAAIAGVGACSDGPTAANMEEALDPTLIEQRTSDVETVYEHPALASLLATSNPVLLQVSPASAVLGRASGKLIEAQRAMLSDARQRSIRPAMSVAAFEPTIPASMLGTVFVYDEVESGWLIDENREGPADGVRFMLRALDEAGGLTQTEIGSIDIRDLTTDSQLRLVTTLRAGALTVLSFEERLSGESEIDNAWTFAGYLSDGVHRVDLSTTERVTPSGDSYRLVVDFGWSTRSGASFQSQWVDGATTVSDKDWLQVRFGSTTVRYETPYVYYEGEGAYWPGEVTNIYANGRIFAVATGETVTQPNGEPLEADQAESLWFLQFVVQSITEDILTPLYLIDSLLSNVHVIL